jgi:hypothetical protein
MYTYKVINKPAGRSYLQKVIKNRCEHVTAEYAPQSRRSKAHRATDVHRIAKHVERETLNAGIHEDTEIIAQEGARDAKGPCRAHDEGLPDDEERGGDERIERSGQEARTRLFCDCA